jgi:hypothetical protein
MISQKKINIYVSFCLMAFIHNFCFKIFTNNASTIDLGLYEQQFISQFGEDGVIQKIFDVIGITNKYYVEFGAGNGHFCSDTKYLREKDSWKGLLLDGFYETDSSINLHKEFITAENICNLFKKYDVPQEFDLLSIDIDMNDFYVWHALSKLYRPRVVVIEFNSYFDCKEDKVIKYSPSNVWAGDEYFGSGIRALFNLGRKIGYSLVYQESAGVNLFFIRDDVIDTCCYNFAHINNVEAIYRRHEKRYTGGIKSLDSKKVSGLFISSSQALKD